MCVLTHPSRLHTARLASKLAGSVAQTGTPGVFYQLLGKTGGLAFGMKMSYTSLALVPRVSILALLTQGTDPMDGSQCDHVTMLQEAILYVLEVRHATE